MSKNWFFQDFRLEKFFFENWAPSLFGNRHFASLCEKSVKTNEPIPRKAGNRRTDGQMDEHWLIYRTSGVGPKIVLYDLLAICISAQKVY